MNKKATVAAVLACALMGCSEQDETVRTEAVDQTANEPAAPTTEPDVAQAPSEAVAIVQDVDVEEVASAVRAGVEEDADAISPLDEELCGVLETKGLDLPTPEASEVTITGFDPDDSITLPNTLSNAGTYRVTVELGEEGIAVGVPFDLAVRFTKADGERVPPAVYLDATAYMPMHFHGMNVDPVERPTKVGAYTIEGMMFHMTGMWEVYLDFTRAGVTERAQFVFEVK